MDGYALTYKQSASGMGARVKYLGARLTSNKRVISLRELQSETQEELDALLPSHRDAAQSVLRPQGGAFRGEL
jgi:hypothetical protein